MRSRSTISFKIGLGFGILIVAILVSTFLTNRNIKQINRLNLTLSETIDPGIDVLHTYFDQVQLSEKLFLHYLLSDPSTESSDLENITHLRKDILPGLITDLMKLSDYWTAREQERIAWINNQFTDNIFPLQDSLIYNFISSNPDPYHDSIVSETIVQLSSLYELAYSEINLLNNKLLRLRNEEKTIIDTTISKSASFVIVLQLLISLAALITAFLLIRSLVKPIFFFRKTLSEISKGELPENKIPEGKNELGQMAVALNTLIKSLRTLSTFSQEIGKGNYDSEFTPLGENDILGNSLLMMRENLRNAAIEEFKHREEDEIRNWSTQGIARFNEILREYSSQFEKLTQQVIGNLVKYLDANVGGLYLLNKTPEGETVIELVTSYAYNRKKYIKREIALGEGLVGRCVQESETIFMTDVPADYLKIKSGLGEERPTCLLIAPLKFNEEIIGVVELASIKEFKPHQVEFVERINTSIASSMASITASKHDKAPSRFDAIIAGKLPDDKVHVREELKKVKFIADQVKRREQELKDHLKNL